MDVVVDDGDFAAPWARACPPRRMTLLPDRTHRAVALRVMPRRAHERDGRPVRPGHDPFHGVDRGAGGEQRDVVRFGRRVGVRIELRRFPGRFGNPAEVVAVVHARELLGGRLARCHDVGAALAPAGGHRVHDLGALGPLDAPAASGVRRSGRC
jgi:hypothetical protein